MAIAFYRFCITLGLISALAGCRREDPDEGMSTGQWWRSTNSPSIALWDGGIPMIGKMPFVVFAIWDDGFVVRNAKDRVVAGWITTQEVRHVMTAVEKSGFFHSPIRYGLVRPDGPLQCLAVVRNGQAVQFSYDGFTDFESYGPESMPTRKEMEEFVGMWRNVERVLAAVAPKRVRDFEGERALKFPGRD